MDWGLFSAIAGVAGINIALMVGLISWLRSDLKSFEVEIRGWNKEILKDSREFHGRFCAIEEKNRK
jgi:hypothetical protein